MLSDTLGPLGAILGAVLVLAGGWRLADPIAAAGIGFFIIPRTWRLLREAADVLLEGSPAHIDLNEVRRVMRQAPGVRDVHDLHVWTLASGSYAMSGHVVFEDVTASERILRSLHTTLHERFGVVHTTIQIETVPLIQIGPGGQPPVPPERRGGYI